MTRDLSCSNDDALRQPLAGPTRRFHSAPSPANPSMTREQRRQLRRQRCNGRRCNSARQVSLTVDSKCDDASKKECILLDMALVPSNEFHQVVGDEIRQEQVTTCGTLEESSFVLSPAWNESNHCNFPRRQQRTALPGAYNVVGRPTDVPPPSLEDTMEQPPPPQRPSLEDCMSSRRFESWLRRQQQGSQRNNSSSRFFRACGSFIDATVRRRFSTEALNCCNQENQSIKHQFNSIPPELRPVRLSYIEQETTTITEEEEEQRDEESKSRCDEQQSPPQQRKKRFSPLNLSLKGSKNNRENVAKPRSTVSCVVISGTKKIITSPKRVVSCVNAGTKKLFGYL